MTTPHVDHASTDAPTHPWAAAWSALSPHRRTALLSRIVDREPVATLAGRLGRSEQDAGALITSSLLAFRREVVLGIGTGYAEECGALILRLVDSAGGTLTKADRKALAAHADSCPECARAVGELLELDARLRDGLIQLIGTDAPHPPATPAVPAPRGATSTDDAWAPAFEMLTAERRTALVHGAAGAESPSDLADRLGTTEPAARQLAASSVVAFRQTVLRGLPAGTGAGCAIVTEHRTGDIALDGARTRALKAHAAACGDCAPAVAEILALQESLRQRVAVIALGDQADSWLKAAPRRTWVPGVERPTEALDRRRRLGVGAGLVAAAVVAVAVLGGGQPDSAPVDVATDVTTDVAAAETPVIEVSADDSTEVGDANGRADRVSEQVVLAGARLSALTPVAVDGPGPTGAVVFVEGGGEDQPGGPAKDPNGPGGPGDPGPEPTPPLDVQVDTGTGSVTVTVGLLGDPIVISTPPITAVNKR